MSFPRPRSPIVRVASAAALGLLVSVASAAAQDAEDPEEPPAGDFYDDDLPGTDEEPPDADAPADDAPAGAPASYTGPAPGTSARVSSYRGKFGVSAQFGMGLRGIAPYDDEYCGDLTEEGGFNELCLGRSPLRMDLVVAWAPTEKVELLGEIRVGIERDFGSSPSADGPRIRHWGLGAKIYHTEAGKTRFFSTLQFVIDTTGYDQADEADYRFKNTNGFQVDVHPTVGLYAFFGEILGWRRWLSAELEAGLGIQARFP